MGKNGLLNMAGRVAKSSLNFTDKSGVRYFDQAWLRKATGILGARKGI